MVIGAPAPSPCGSCPYRRDVPSGVWSEEEYAKLVGYDGETWEQAVAGAVGVFFCHQQDGRVCAGWASVHGDVESFALRMASALVDEATLDAILDYESPVPLFSSGAEAAAHGRAEVEAPGEKAVEMVRRLERKRRGRR